MKAVRNATVAYAGCEVKNQRRCNDLLREISPLQNEAGSLSDEADRLEGDAERLKRDATIELAISVIAELSFLEVQRAVLGLLCARLREKNLEALPEMIYLIF